ncbi:MAG TPA: efflux RND transporter permease subunit [Planctomycetota bacterium]|nr:efflux RND transporter permease subunit [Planctomycetota bacterium]
MSSGSENRGDVGNFAIRHARGIYFIILALCLAGIYAARTMPSSVFPQTNFPRVTIDVENGVMPTDEMMATITRPIEEAVKDIQGVVNVRSATGRGSANIDVFFNWSVDMTQAELFVMSHLAQIRSTLPATAETSAHRLTFSAFPILGISLTSKTHTLNELWETARYTIKPRFLRIPGIARVDIVGGSPPEFHILANPARLEALHLSLAQISDELGKTNQVASAGLHEENNLLYLTIVDGRVHTIEEIENLSVASADGRPVRVKEFARVVQDREPANNRVTAARDDAVLVNVRSQPDGSTLAISDAVKAEMKALKSELPPGIDLAFFYDQSLLVRASVQSVWEAVIFGLILSFAIVFLFLKNWGTTLVAAAVIPVTVLITLIAMRLAGLSFNLMTLGGIAASIGLIIDDAIVVVEAIYAKMAAGYSRFEAIHRASSEILSPLIGSTLTPVVVFIPLAFLDGVPGVFFRALAISMSVSLLASLALALTLTPALAGLIVRVRSDRDEAKLQAAHDEESEHGGFILRFIVRAYGFALGWALRDFWLVPALCVVVVLASIGVYRQLETEFLPPMDEGGFVIDYEAQPGTSLSETDRELREVEEILDATPEIESYSRRTGTALGFEQFEPNKGDFLVKLKADKKRHTKEVIAEIRDKLAVSKPQIDWEFPGILSDLIGDLSSKSEPVEIKLYSPDINYLKRKAPQIKGLIKKVPGIVDEKAGLFATGPSISLRVRSADAQRFGIDADDIAKAVNTALLGQASSAMLQGDRVVNIRVRMDPERIKSIDTIRQMLVRAPNGAAVRVSQVADVIDVPGDVELQRDNLRQKVSITASLQGTDLGTGMEQIRKLISEDTTLPPGSIEYGGLYEQQQESFHNLAIVLIVAVILVFTVLLLEFRSFAKPLAIVLGALLALSGTVFALWITHTTLNVISLLGAIIGIGIVAKNGILMLDFVEQLRERGLSFTDALIRSGQRRLRPVLMTSMAAALGMLPLAYGIGTGADMLKPLAIAVIGALCISVLLSLVATPTIYALFVPRRLKK